MKASFLTLFGLCLVRSALGQGTIHFSTRVGSIVDARVHFVDGHPVDSSYLGQLYVGLPGTHLFPVGSPTPFRNSPADLAGYITSGETITVPGIPGGSTVHLKMVAWWSERGKTYAEAIGIGCGNIGESEVLQTFVLGNAGLEPTPPALLVGLTGFSVAPITAQCPEPSPLGIVLAGACLLRTFQRVPRHPGGLHSIGR